MYTSVNLSDSCTIGNIIYAVRVDVCSHLASFVIMAPSTKIPIQYIVHRSRYKLFATSLNIYRLRFDVDALATAFPLPASSATALVLDRVTLVEDEATSVA